MGICDSSRESIRYILNKGDSVSLVVGGARESLNARPGTYDLVLKEVGLSILMIRIQM